MLDLTKYNLNDDELQIMRKKIEILDIAIPESNEYPRSIICCKRSKDIVVHYRAGDSTSLEKLQHHGFQTVFRRNADHVGMFRQR